MKAKIIPLIAALGFGLVVSVSAQPVKAPHLEAQLLAENPVIRGGQPFWTGLHLKMEPGWHVYWKNPGDAGLPVSLAWTLPSGFSAGPIQWPYPSRIAAASLMNFGYEGEVFFPVLITPPAQLPKEPVVLRAKAKWVVCQEICLPGSAELTLSLPAAAAGSAPSVDPARQELFRMAREKLPLASSPWLLTAQATDSTVTVLFTPPPDFQGEFPGAIFFPGEQDVIENAADQRFFAAEGGGYALELKRVAPEEEAGKTPLGGDVPQTLAGVLVSSGGWGSPGGEKALELRIPLVPAQREIKPLAGAPIVVNGGGSTPSVPVAAAVAPDAESAGLSPKISLLLMLSFAFLGGLILNLMPCVLPVLSLKIFDFVKRAGESRWKVFSHGLIFTVGVLISFWFLAGLLLVLRRGGQQLGWGFQLQSPSFLIVLCALFFFFSLNLFGVFEIGYLLTRLGGTRKKSGFGGSFLAGVTATVVATPCTAPFMGSAMGYAFTQPPQYAMLVFTVLGLGMASPYLLLSGFPGLMRFLPKPGEWMEHFKQFMGFPLLATAIWLAWVLGKQAGIDALVALLFLLLLGGISAWILGKWAALHRSTPVRRIAGLVALVVFLPAFLLVLLFLDRIRDMPGKTRSEATAVVGDAIAWEPFSPEKLENLVSRGKPVFLDFTADWCLSCKVNERVALNTPEVGRRFNALKLTALKADWTSPDEIIAKALAKYGRNSIPLYVLYTGHGPKDYRILPEVLSPGIVLDALKSLETP